MRHKSNRGFTLIELMTVVAVVGILTAIALPSYNEYIRRGHRADARAGLLQAAQYLERAATANGVYPTSVTGYTLPVALSWTGTGADASKRYSIAVAGTANAFTLTATRKAGTAQATDKCGNLTLTNTGARGMVTGTTTLDVNECWNK